KTNLAKFTRMLQGQRDFLPVGKLILCELAPLVSAQQGAFYMIDNSNGESELKLLASYAFQEGNGARNRFKIGESLVGQAALEKRPILLTDVPSNYAKVSSGLGEFHPTNIVVLPILFEGQVKAVMELSSVERFSPAHQAFLDQLTESIGIVLNTIEASTKTENLLKQSQSLAAELQKTNLELAEKARSNLAKDQFLAMLSHELRTPLTPVLASALALESEPELPKEIQESVKLTPPNGQITITTSNDSSGQLRVEIADTGLGIESAALPKIFDAFEQGGRTQLGGLGLGLAISKTLVEAHKGTITAQSAGRNK